MFIQWKFIKEVIMSSATDYERIKTKLHELERNVEKWKVIAGRLNEQLGKGG